MGDDFLNKHKEFFMDLSWHFVSIVLKLFKELLKLFNGTKQLKGSVLLPDFNLQKPANVEFFEKRKKYKVYWNLYGEKEDWPWEGVITGKFDLAKLNIERLWVGLPYCPKCKYCVLEQKTPKWECVNCKKKINIDKAIIDETQRKVINAFKADLQKEKNEQRKN